MHFRHKYLYLKPILTGLCLAFGFILLLVSFRQKVVTNTRGDRAKHYAQCPVSAKSEKYAQNHLDTELFDKFWSSPLKCYGTFVELGALNGNRFSNTKFFEDYLGWNGVLIEAYYKNFEELKHNRPNTLNFNLAICPEGQGHVNFIGKQGAGGIADKLDLRKFRKFNLAQGEQLKVSCEPIGTLLRKANITKIDLFSLDVEGAELTVLKTMDWSILVHVFIIEMDGTKETTQSITDLMKEKGYIERKGRWYINKVFVNPRYKANDL